MEDAADPAGDSPRGQKRRRDGRGLGITPRSRVDPYAAVERFVIRPWPERRARRVKWVVLALILLAPMAGIAVSWFGVVGDTSEDLVEPVGAQADSVLMIDATAQAVDLQRNEMSFRLVFRPSGEMVERAVLSEDVTLLVNDAAGASIKDFAAGTVMEPTTVVVPIDGSQIVRYPFDAYETELVIGAITPLPDGGSMPLTIDLALDVSIEDFAATASTERHDSAVTVHLDLGRRASVVLWVVFFMVLVWGIALGCGATSWFLLIYAKEPPRWVFPFFAAVLFALTNLRTGLPGRPPYGSLVDWASFYWSIVIVAIGLVGLLALWNIEARARLHEHDRRDPSAPRQRD
ncbi:MAG: DUF4436 domain-containing protein [Actinomycetota bacterium]|nr:DUF4436 domain-containing protein [Actinomycetota bacterium]